MTALRDSTPADRPRLLLVLALLVLVAAGGWIMLRMYTSGGARGCVTAYREARTAADTARVDSMVPDSSDAEPRSCGSMRTTARLP